MPRTKANKNIAAKRARENNASEIEDILRDFDIEQEQVLQTMRNMHKLVLEDADMVIENFKNSLPPRVLKLTMGELKKLKSYGDIDADVQQNMNDLNMTVKETIQKVDEGYITGEASNRSQLTSDTESNNGDMRKVSIVSSLKTFKTRRRSQSTSNIPTHTTPGPRAMMKLKTPNVKSSTVEPFFPSSAIHASRSKFRTPLVQKNQKRAQRAASADPFATIKPKVDPSAPIAVLRHAKPDEIAFSITGSPIAQSHFGSQSANINIPYNNGVLMIRPESIDQAALDSTLINNIAGMQIDEMRTLKNALDILVSNFEKRKRNK